MFLSKHTMVVLLLLDTLILLNLLHPLASTAIYRFNFNMFLGNQMMGVLLLLGTMLLFVASIPWLLRIYSHLSLYF
jgi:hypothetical protein